MTDCYGLILPSWCCWLLVSLQLELKNFRHLSAHLCLQISVILRVHIKAHVFLHIMERSLKTFVRKWKNWTSNKCLDYKKRQTVWSAFSCDPVGARTQDLQLRRLLLYPTELRNHYFARQNYDFFPSSQIFYHSYTQKHPQITSRLTNHPR